MSGQNGHAVPTPGEAADAVGKAAEDRLIRGMNHRVWLADFAAVLEISPKGRDMPMTPFRAGAISRLRMAARYISLLEQDLTTLTSKLNALAEKLNKGDPDAIDGR